MLHIEWLSYTNVNNPHCSLVHNIVGVKFKIRFIENFSKHHFIFKILTCYCWRHSISELAWTKFDLLIRGLRMSGFCRNVIPTRVSRISRKRFIPLQTQGLKRSCRQMVFFRITTCEGCICIKTDGLFSLLI